MVSGVESRLRAMTAGERRVTRAPETMIWPLDLVGKGGDSSVRCVRLTERSSDSRDSQRELERRVVEVITGLAGGLGDDFSSVTKFPLRSGALVPKLANHAFPDSVLTVRSTLYYLQGRDISKEANFDVNGGPRERQVFSFTDLPPLLLLDV